MAAFLLRPLFVAPSTAYQKIRPGSGANSSVIIPAIITMLEPALKWRQGVIWPKARYLSRTAGAWLALCTEPLSGQAASHNRTQTR